MRMRGVAVDTSVIVRKGHYTALDGGLAVRLEEGMIGLVVNTDLSNTLLVHFPIGHCWVDVGYLERIDLLQMLAEASADPPQT